MAKLALRPWIRAVHRDLGYLAVGLTLVYALSGLAVNHVSDWDPSFQSYERTAQAGGPRLGWRICARWAAWRTASTSSHAAVMPCTSVVKNYYDWYA